MKKVSLLLGICGLLAVLVVLVYSHTPLSHDLFAERTGTSLKITDRRGIVLRELLSPEGERTTWLPYDELPEPVIQAILAAEDKRFFSHSGVDLLALTRAVGQNIWAGRIVSGASTITQQLIKNHVGYPRTLWGKLREMLLALRLEATIPKQEILTQYLNRVGFSNQVFGIEAAARLYFGKPAQHLSLAESVFLIGIIQAPTRFNPYRHFDHTLQRQRHLLERMFQHGTISDTAYHIALQEEIRLVPKQVNFKAPHFCELVLDQRSDRLDGSDPAVIRTTLDYYLQEQVEDIVTTRIDELADYNVTNAAIIVMDNRHGDILAFVGSKDFFDETISGQVNGALALRQPGSTLKPFTYQLALEHGYTPATLLPDIKDFPSDPRSFLPENYDRKFHGPVRLREALACSYNIPAVRVLEAIGVEALYARLKEFGLTSLREPPEFYGPGLTLGNGEVTLLELTHAYSILARRGKAVTPRYLLPEKPETPDVQSAPQLFSPRVLYLLTHILADRQ
ncbi:penicillin-binding protein 1C, partial [candidate division KSB3 bacterium]|nr:penicillin-binding protein 1C [candidate division KSB3 bacterium]MBD3324406.1 penicillin-binding protein 1C [candidate division KSB3 bacterium]